MSPSLSVVLFSLVLSGGQAPVGKLPGGRVAAVSPVRASQSPGRHPVAANVFRRIDERFRAGLMDSETRHLYRLAAVRRPELLPAGLRELVDAGRSPPRLSLTPLFLEAMRWVRSNAAEGGAVHRLLLPPADLPYLLDSTTHDIRVSYETQEQATFAQWVLGYAETSWDILTQEYGFWEPPIEPAAGRYRIFIQSTFGNGAAYTAPYDENPATPHTDYFTYIVVDPTANSQWNISGTVAHEMNHANQAAMDVLEPAAFWENTSTFIMSRVFPDQVFYTVYMMSMFQQQPWRALDYMNMQYSDGYEYGGGLFLWYLANTYAPSDPAQFVAEIWQGCVQDSLPNEPDYFDSIEALLAERGHDLTMEDVLMDFSEARFFVGTYDDGAHVPNAFQLDSAEVAVVARHSYAQLPLRGEAPLASRQPAAFGSNHLLLDVPTSAADPIRVLFDGDDDTRWRARAVLFGADRQTVSTELELSVGTWDGSVLLEPQGYDGILLVVANLGQEGYDPDQYDSYRPWPTSGYTYGFERVLELPSDLSLVPEVLERGRQNVEVVLQGVGLVGGGDFNLEFADPDIQIVSIDLVMADQVSFKITIPMLVELGPKDLVVTNSDGQQVTANGILTVVDPGDIPADGGVGGGDRSAAGCGCGTGGEAGGSGLVLAGLLLWLFWLVGQRRLLRLARPVERRRRRWEG